MISIGESEKVVKLDVEGSKEDILYVWRNDQVDPAQLVQIVRTGEWSKLEQVEGFFGVICKKAGKIYLFCDRLGIYPLFYSATKSEICAAPTIPDLLTVVQSGLAPSNDGIVSLLLFGHYLAGETIFEDIKRCNGGETIVINKIGNVEEKIVWKKKHFYHDKRSIEANSLAELFVKDIERSIPIAGKVILTMSGGFDSRAVLGGALECIPSERIRTLTFGGNDAYDLRIARFVAKKAGVENVAFLITDQIFDDNFLRQRAGDYGYGYSAFATQPQEMLSYLSKEDSESSISLWGAGGDAITGSHLCAGDISLDECDSYEDFARLLICKRSRLPVTLACEIMSFHESEIIGIIANLIEKSPFLGQHDKPWQFLDAWDIFVRGRMELISVLPFNKRSWRCPHLSQNYFSQMSTQCFEEKFDQNAYKRMLSSRFKFLFSLPTRRLKGKSLIGAQWRNLYWIMCWRAGRVSQSLREITGQEVDSIGRNYGKNKSFLTSNQGKEKLQSSINILRQHGILGKNTGDIFEILQKNIQAELMLISLGYAFDKQY